MKSNDSLQQVRPPFAMALTAVFASLLASTTSADHPGNPLILIPLLMLLPWEKHQKRDEDQWVSGVIRACRGGE